jgi:hypothetical protein
MVSQTRLFLITKDLPAFCLPEKVFEYKRIIAYDLLILQEKNGNDGIIYPKTNKR